MKTLYTYAGAVALLLTMLALSACGGTASEPGITQPTGAPESSTTQAAEPTSTPTATPSQTALPPATSNVASTPGPGFTTTPVPLPEGFPLLPGARFVAYNPAFDPCANGKLLCPQRQFPPQVWLYEIEFPANSMGPAAPHVVIAGRYAALLKTAGYTVETQAEQGATTLTFSQPANAAAPHGSILVGPPVSDHTPSAGMILVGLRITIEPKFLPEPPAQEGGAGEPGFTATPFPLPAGFPILPLAQFVGYNPAFDPCAQGQRDCAPGRVTEQVWLYEIYFPPNTTIPVLTARTAGDQYANLLKAAGYQVEVVLGDEATLLNFTGPAGSSVQSGSIIVGPSVSGRTVPADARLIGLRIAIEHQ